MFIGEFIWKVNSDTAFEIAYFSSSRNACERLFTVLTVVLHECASAHLNYHDVRILCFTFVELPPIMYTALEAIWQPIERDTGKGENSERNEWDKEAERKETEINAVTFCNTATCYLLFPSTPGCMPRKTFAELSSTRNGTPVDVM